MKKQAASKKQIKHKGSVRSLEEIAPEKIREKRGGIEYISVEHDASKPPLEPELPPVSTVRRQVTCSGCGTKGYTYSGCPAKLLKS